MMNILTLRFKSEKLESEYQQYREDNQIGQITVQSGSSLFIGIPYLVTVLAQQQYIDFGTTAVLIAVLIWCYYKLKCGIFKPQKIIKVYDVFVLLIPVVTCIIRIFTNMSNSEIVQTAAILIMLATVMPLTGNILLGTVQYLSIIFTACFLLYQVLGMDMKLMILFWYSLFWLVLRYHQIKQNRHLFVKSLTNDSIYDILRSTTKEDLIIFKYDEENRKYDLIFEKININCQFKLLPFLSNLKLQNNISLSDYIWKFQTTIKDYKPQEIQLTGCYGEDRIRYNINLYIQNYPKQTFIIKLYQSQEKKLLQECCKNEHNIINQFMKTAMKIVVKNQVRIKQEMWHLVLAYQLRLNLSRIYTVQRCINIEVISLDNMIYKLSRLFQMKPALNSSYIINSDKNLLSILIQQILLLIHSNNKHFAVQFIELDEYSMKIRFRFHSAINLDLDVQQKLQIMKLVNKLSLYEPQLQRNQIDIDLIRNLGSPFRNN